MIKGNLSWEFILLGFFLVFRVVFDIEDVAVAGDAEDEEVDGGQERG